MKLGTFFPAKFTIILWAGQFISLIKFESSLSTICVTFIFLLIYTFFIWFAEDEIPTKRNSSKHHHNYGRKRASKKLRQSASRRNGVKKSISREESETELSRSFAVMRSVPEQLNINGVHDIKRETIRENRSLGNLSRIKRETKIRTKTNHPTVGQVYPKIHRSIQTLNKNEHPRENFIILNKEHQLEENINFKRTSIGRENAKPPTSSGNSLTTVDTMQCTATSTSSIPFSDSDDFEFDFDYDDSHFWMENRYQDGTGDSYPEYESNPNIVANYNNNNENVSPRESSTCTTLTESLESGDLMPTPIINFTTPLDITRLQHPTIERVYPNEVRANKRKYCDALKAKSEMIVHEKDMVKRNATFCIVSRSDRNVSRSDRNACRSDRNVTKSPKSYEMATLKIERKDSDETSLTPSSSISIYNRSNHEEDNLQHEKPSMKCQNVNASSCEHGSTDDQTDEGGRASANVCKKDKDKFCTKLQKVISRCSAISHGSSNVSLFNDSEIYHLEPKIRRRLEKSENQILDTPDFPQNKTKSEGKSQDSRNKRETTNSKPSARFSSSKSMENVGKTKPKRVAAKLSKSSQDMNTAQATSQMEADLDTIETGCFLDLSQERSEENRDERRKTITGSRPSSNLKRGCDLKQWGDTGDWSSDDERNQVDLEEVTTLKDGEWGMEDTRATKKEGGWKRSNTFKKEMDRGKDKEKGEWSSRGKFRFKSGTISGLNIVSYLPNKLNNNTVLRRIDYAAAATAPSYERIHPMREVMTEYVFPRNAKRERKMNSAEIDYVSQIAKEKKGEIAQGRPKEARQDHATRISYVGVMNNFSSTGESLTNTISTRKKYVHSMEENSDRPLEKEPADKGRTGSNTNTKLESTMKEGEEVNPNNKRVPRSANRLKTIYGGERKNQAKVKPRAERGSDPDAGEIQGEMEQDALGRVQKDLHPCDRKDEANTEEKKERRKTRKKMAKSMKNRKRSAAENGDNINDSPDVLMAVLSEDLALKRFNKHGRNRQYNPETSNDCGCDDASKNKAIIPELREEAKNNPLLNHLLKYKSVYFRIGLFLSVVSYWNWQTGGFGAKQEFLRNMKSASISAVAASTVADSISMAKKKKREMAQGNQ